MKKILVFMVMIFFIAPTILALNLEVEKTSDNEVMVVGVDRPAVFDLKITNNGPDDYIEFYNLVSFRMFPVEKVQIKAFETKEIQLKISPIGEFDYTGAYTFNYYIRGQDGSQIEKQLTFRRVPINDMFEIGAGDFDPQSNKVEVYVRNKEHFDFGEINAKLSSAFFNVQETFTLGPKETKNFSISLNKEDFKKLVAGFYTMDAEITAGTAKTDLQTNLKFVEKNIITEKEESYGFIVNTRIIKKTNEGNVISPTQTTIKKNIISRLFTTFNPEPDSVERRGLIVTYAWIRDINPGEVLEISVKTNWTFPLIIVILVIVIIVLAKQYTKTNLSLKKQVTFVRAKGGEFALKVSVMVHPKRYMENVTIIDKLPPLVKLYEKFGLEKPSRIDEKNKRIEWSFPKLESGEIRILSYIIYSKVGVLGRFALPPATGVYEKNGEVHETESNRAFFVAEQRTRDLPEEE